MSPPAWPLLAVLGLLVGLGVRSAVWRLASDDPPRTNCPSCRVGSRLVSVRPVAGSCAGCGARTYPPLLMPEVLCATGFALAGWIGGGPLRVAAVCWLAAFGVAAALVDVAVQRLPDVLTWPCLAGVVAFSCGQAAASGSLSTSVRTVAAGASTAGLFLILALAFDVGLGDVKISASTGAALGYLSWSAAVAGCAAGFVLAGLYAAVALVERRTSLSARLALGPFLVAGAFLALAVAS